jgi:hypothetical protein
MLLGEKGEQMMESCLSCKFTANKDGGSLSCQRYPQQLRVARSHWCGEWKADPNYTIPVKRAKERLAVKPYNQTQGGTLDV